MNEQLIDINDAQNDLLACATFLAEKIGSSDGHAEAMKELIPYYLAKDEVDTAAELANSIEDPFVRDELLMSVARKCAEIGDDEYAFQLMDTLEDPNHQVHTLEDIAGIQASQNNFDKAFQTAAKLPDQSMALENIAIHQNTEEALQTIDKIDNLHSKIHILIALSTKTDDVLLLDKAFELAKEIDFKEEKIRALLNIGFQYIEAKRKDKAIEVLDKARQFSETLDSIQKDSFLSQISQGFMKAGSLDLADRTLDLVKDKYEIANTLVGYADEYWAKDEKEDALEALDEAYQILKSQKDTETRNSKAKFNLLGLIAIKFAAFGKLERAIEIANENLYDEIRNNSLVQISVICQKKEKDDLANQAINDIDDEAEKTLAMIASSDIKRKSERKDEALKQLNEAYFHIGTVQQLSMKSLILNNLADRFNLLGESEKARRACSENLQVINEILDESYQVSALAGLANTFEDLKFELNDADKDILQTMIRKTAW